MYGKCIGPNRSERPVKAKPPLSLGEKEIIIST